jgi:hypothetical protein
MSCANEIGSSPIVNRTPPVGWIDLVAYGMWLVALIDAVQEASEMRRAAFRRYRLADE